MVHGNRERIVSKIGLWGCRLDLAVGNEEDSSYFDWYFASHLDDHREPDIRVDLWTASGKPFVWALLDDNELKFGLLRFPDGRRTEYRFRDSSRQRALFPPFSFEPLVHRFRVLHAAAMAWPVDPSKALVIGGPSGSGKSTLGLALALEGWSMLSDDQLVVGTVDGLIWPYRRPVSLRLASADALGIHSFETPYSFADAPLGATFLVHAAKLGLRQAVAPSCPRLRVELQYVPASEPYEAIDLTLSRPTIRWNPVRHLALAVRDVTAAFELRVGHLA